MKSVILAASRLFPRPARRAIRQTAAFGLDSWLRTRARLVGAPSSPDRYHRVTLGLAELLDCRVPLSATLRNGMPIEVVWKDYVGGRILANGYYEPEIVALLESLLRPGMVFLDIGAHVGQYTLIGSRLVGPGGQVHSFEPDPETFRSLAANCRRNGLANVHLNAVALSGEDGWQRFYFANANDIGSNSLAECDPYNVSGRSAKVRCVTLESYLRQRQITAVDVIKMDVEGAELIVLSGAGRLFAGPQRPVMIVEFEERRQQAFHHSCAELTAWFLERDYRLFVVGETIRPYQPGPDDPRSFNVLAVPAERGGLAVIGR